MKQTMKNKEINNSTNNIECKPILYSFWHV